MSEELIQLRGMNDALFRRRWMDGVSKVEIAAEFGMAVHQISDHVRRLELPRRVPGQVYRAPPEPEAPPPPPPAMAPHPFWTPARDALIWATRGRHAGLMEVAQALGRSIQDVQLRWHRLRAS